MVTCTLTCGKVTCSLDPLCRLFSVVHEHRMQEYSKCCAHQRLLKVTHNKTINKRINIINCLLSWSVTLIMFRQLASQIWRLSKVRTGWHYRWFWKIFERFRLKPIIILHATEEQIILTEQSRHYGILFMKTFYNMVNSIGSACFDRPEYWMSVICHTKLWKTAEL